jgi:acyl-CoA hydrolase
MTRLIGTTPFTSCLMLLTGVEGAQFTGELSTRQANAIAGFLVVVMLALLKREAARIVKASDQMPQVIEALARIPTAEWFERVQVDIDRAMERISAHDEQIDKIDQRCWATTHARPDGA